MSMLFYKLFFFFNQKSVLLCPMMFEYLSITLNSKHMLAFVRAPQVEQDVKLRVSSRNQTFPLQCESTVCEKVCCNCARAIPVKIPCFSKMGDRKETVSFEWYAVRDKSCVIEAENSEV